ncbi:bifunctional hydroxymethylpyrimidine kinase/phosphomethylpyrimidine kinase [Alteriqipengyuania sp. NZ-12B]|uniref:hydroxymethylpyrimidine kinase n=1 Tax=Alteriqipengyuania abyssalis TaxID=2860200 RepID=A0ABS7PBL5_9SPHN|nr:bifunctional hydroxymethylpyrimidine kinase/phosphomethylpyrimidine kinase [Alteriqipengyuania abyssalis]MBY8336438.1 bifunctional hydroxymethylpyrimidine kinase/phosphomethylpyrimidine kinase [Alteriqipengyuania abyssalis]
MSDKPPPRILSIAGSDSGGGAGIQADIKTITMLGGYAMTAITAITAQNSRGVQGITPLSGDFVVEQIDSCLTDFGADAIKIGMLHDAGIIAEVAKGLATLPEAQGVPLILDPVMVATSGARLLREDAVEIMREQLFPLATLLTPNLPELEILAGQSLTDTGQIVEASIALAEANDCHVLAKGGHTDDARVIDILCSPEGFLMQFDDAKIDSRHTHGTGCTLSAAIATLVGHGQPLHHAIRLARQFTRAAIENAPGFGDGHGPMGHQAVRKL